IALIAILKTGASYVPMQVDYPLERLHFIQSNASIKTVITEQCLLKNIATAKTCVLEHVDWETMLAQDNSLPTLVGFTHQQQALYNIYTSGSTGLPKGAQVSVQGELNLLAWYEKTLQLTESDTSIIISAAGFDLTQKNFFALLRCGGKLIFPELEF